MTRAPAFAASIVAVAVSTAAVAADGPLSINTRMLVESRARGADGTTSTSLVTPTKVVPGTTVTVVIDYANTGAQAIGGLVIANPVPRNTVYKGPAAGVPQPEVTVDGKTFAPLAQLSVRSAGAARAATPSDVTAVRWRLPSALTAGAKGQFAFEAVLK